MHHWRRSYHYLLFKNQLLFCVYDLCRTYGREQCYRQSPSNVGKRHKMRIKNRKTHSMSPYSHASSEALGIFEAFVLAFFAFFQAFFPDFEDAGSSQSPIIPPYYSVHAKRGREKWGMIVILKIAWGTFKKNILTCIIINRYSPPSYLHSNVL